MLGEQQHIARAFEGFKIEDLRANRDQNEIGAASRFGCDAVAFAGGIDNREIGTVITGEIERRAQPARLCGYDSRIIRRPPIFPSRGARLRVEIDQRDGFPSPGRSNGQADRRGCLAGAALLANKRDSEHTRTIACSHARMRVLAGHSQSVGRRTSIVRIIFSVDGGLAGSRVTSCPRFALRRTFCGPLPGMGDLTG